MDFNSFQAFRPKLLQWWQFSSGIDPKGGGDDHPPILS